MVMTCFLLKVFPLRSKEGSSSIGVELDVSDDEGDDKDDSGDGVDNDDARLKSS